MEALFLLAAVWMLGFAVVGIIKPTLVIRWGKPETRTRSKAFGFYMLLAFLCLSIFIMALPEQDNGNATTAALSPEMQQMASFSATIHKYMDEYDDAPNAILKTELRTKRGEALRSILGGTTHIQGWVGEIKSIETQTDGDAFLKIVPLHADGWTVQTWNNGFSDIASGTTIKKGTPVHAALRALKEGDVVMFAGDFFPNEEFGLEEASITESGSMISPEFIFRFTAIQQK